MPRNSSGTMTLPSPGVPFQSGTTISTTQMNGTLADIATEISDSLSRSGKGGATAPVRVADGTVAAPAVSFTAEPASGIYRAGPTDVRLVVGGVDALKLTGGGVVGPINMPATAGVFATGASTTLTLRGNLAAGDAGGDVAVSSAVARTAGFLLDVQNNGTGKFQVDYQGLARLVNQAAAIQPAGIWTAITPNAGWSLAIADTGYHKDALGFVHLRGGLTNNTGAASGSVLTTNPLPVGFRPTTFRLFSASVGSATPVAVTVNADGTITTPLSIANGGSVYLDVIQFMAQ